jgi:hypothetical protein
MASREPNYQLPMNHGRWVGGYDETTVGLASERHHCPVYLGCINYIDGAHFQAQRRCESLDHRKLGDPS